MLTVATPVTKVDLTMLDDGVVPVSDVKGSVGTNPYIHGAKSDVGTFYNLWLLPTYITTSRWLNCESTNAMPSEIICD
jgi:hypothetical protein